MTNIDDKIRAAIAAHVAEHHLEVREGAAAVELVDVMKGRPADYTDAEVERMARAGNKARGEKSDPSRPYLDDIRCHVNHGRPLAIYHSDRVAGIYAEKAKIDAEKMPPASEPAPRETPAACDHSYTHLCAGCGVQVFGETPAAPTGTARSVPGCCDMGRVWFVLDDEGDVSVDMGGRNRISIVACPFCGAWIAGKEPVDRPHFVMPVRKSPAAAPPPPPAEPRAPPRRWHKMPMGVAPFECTDPKCTVTWHIDADGRLMPPASEPAPRETPAINDKDARALTILDCIAAIERIADGQERAAREKEDDSPCSAEEHAHEARLIRWRTIPALRAMLHATTETPAASVSDRMATVTAESRERAFTPDGFDGEPTTIGLPAGFEYDGKSIVETPAAPTGTARDLTFRALRFNSTTGALSWNNKSAALHPDRCACQDGVTPHKHYDEPPHACARCGCTGYVPWEESVTAPPPPPAEPRAGEALWLDRMPTAEEVSVGGTFHSWWRWRQRPGESWHVRKLGALEGGKIMEDRGRFRWEELPSLHGQWCIVEDPRPTVTPAPAPQPVTPRRCGNPTCYAHDGETCAKGAMKREECEEWHRCAPQPVSGEAALLLNWIAHLAPEHAGVAGQLRDAVERMSAPQPVSGEAAELIADLRAKGIDDDADVVERLAQEVERLKRDNRERRDEYHEVNERANQCSQQRCEALNEAATLRARVAELEAERDNFERLSETYNRRSNLSSQLIRDTEIERDTLSARVAELESQNATLDARLVDAVNAVPTSAGKE